MAEPIFETLGGLFVIGLEVAAAVGISLAVYRWAKKRRSQKITN